MKSARQSLPRKTEEGRQPTRRIKFLPLIVIGAGLGVYANSFDATLIFDDRWTILDNPRIRQLWPPWEILDSRRPVAELSLAVNYALGELNVWGYHAFNLAIHVLSALTLYGIVRRTLRIATTHRKDPLHDWLAMVTALIWVVHPLQTQSVTYVVQRSESMMGLFYLLTLYCLIRGADSSHRRGWLVGSIVSCALGMGSKAVMVTAPVVMLLYDRIFLTGSFRATLRRRWGLYLALTATWGVLWTCGVARGVLDPTPKARATVGFAYKGITPLEYARTQPGVILHYLKLSLWPHPLCLDYQWPVARTVKDTLPPTLVIVGLVAGTVWALRRRPAFGFVGLWFFLILAPTSSFIPIKDPLFEHRMYLPLTAVIVLIVVGAYRAGEYFFIRVVLRDPMRRLVSLVSAAAIVVFLGYVTVQRNEVYRSNRSIWSDVVAKRPRNERAHYNLGNALKSEGDLVQAIEEYHQAIRLKSRYTDAYVNLGLALADQGKLDEAISLYHQALGIKPRLVDTHINLGAALEAKGRLKEAIAAYRTAVSLKPAFAVAHYNLGNALMKQGQLTEAIQAYRDAVSLKPDYIDAYNNLGVAYARRGMLNEAIRTYRQGLEFDPQSAEAHTSLGTALAQQGRLEEAIEEYRNALAIKPSPIAHFNIGNALNDQGKLAEAIKEYRRALALNPTFAHAHYNLGNALTKQGKTDEAIEEYQATLRLTPNHTGARKALDAARAKQTSSTGP